MAAKRKNSNPLSKKTDWTITEFQMWLAGAYALQGEDWVPNAEQWNMVVDIIYKLKDRPTQKKLAPSPPPYNQNQVPQPADFGGGVPMGPMPVVGGVFDQIDVPEEAGMSLSELKRRREGGPSNSNVLTGGGAPGEKVIKTGAFD